MHRWAQFKQVDSDLEVPGKEAVWLTRCRYCGAERGSGVYFTLSLAGVLAAAAALLWWLVSPVLGVLVLMGALMSLLALARAFAYGRPSRLGLRYRG